MNMGLINNYYTKCRISAAEFRVLGLVRIFCTVGPPLMRVAVVCLLASGVLCMGSFLAPYVLILRLLFDIAPLDFSEQKQH